MNPICLGYCSFRFSKSVPLKRMASSQNFCLWSAGSYFASRVWYSTEQNPAGYQTPQNNTLQGIRPRRTKFCWISDPAVQCQSCVHFIVYTCSAGPDTPQNSVLRGLIPCLTKSCGVSDPAEQHSKRIFLRIRKRIQKYFRVWIWGLMGSIRRKNQR
jgi:hypothetical protein